MHLHRRKFNTFVMPSGVRVFVLALAQSLAFMTAAAVSMAKKWLMQATQPMSINDAQRVLQGGAIR
jgi:hypothetical protein